MAFTRFSSSLDELQALLEACRSLEPRVESSGQSIINSLKNGGKLLVCGNGGSAADALHLVEELVGRFRLNRQPLPAVCLSADSALITCIGNDFGYESIFSRPVTALGRHGDVLVVFTTSGNSPNVLKALDAASERGLITILVGGRDGGAALGKCDHELVVPSDSTARIQEVHTIILHQWLEMIEAESWVCLDP